MRNALRIKFINFQTKNKNIKKIVNAKIISNAQSLKITTKLISIPGRIYYINIIKHHIYLSQNDPNYVFRGNTILIFNFIRKCFTQFTTKKNDSRANI